jgi:hypothetical protein
MAHQALPQLSADVGASTTAVDELGWGGDDQTDRDRIRF